MANNVLFSRSDFTGFLKAGSLIKLSPLTGSNVSGSFIAGAEPITQTCDITASTTFHTLFAGKYSVDFLSGLKRTHFKILVPEGASTLNAKDLIYGS